MNFDHFVGVLVKNLLATNPFFGHTLQCINIVASHDANMIAAVGVKDSRITMIINQERFADFSIGMGCAVIIHELYHILFGHLHISIPKDQNRQRYNIAMDLAINQYVTGLPENCLSIGQFKDKNGKDLAPFKTWEYYFENVNLDSCSGEGGSGEGSSDHNFGDEDIKTKELVEELTDNLIRRVKQKISHSHDLMPPHLSQFLDDKNNINDKKFFRNVLMSSMKKTVMSIDKKSTFKKPNRRYGLNIPAHTRGNEASIHLFIDCSGSISETELNKFLDVVDGFLSASSNKKCKINLFHTGIFYSGNYGKSSREHLKTKVQSGGTDLQEVFNQIALQQPDLSVILTDGYYGKINYSKKIKDLQKRPNDILFIISEEGDISHPLRDIGKTIKAKF